MKEYPLCRHIKTNGLQCLAPALTGGQWCYFHNRLHDRHARFRPTDATSAYFTNGRDLELCALEDRESVQLAISVVVNAIATNRIDTRRATALLYGLQLASSNAASLNNAPNTPAVVRTVESSPDGLDLAEPGAIIEVFTRLELDSEPPPPVARKRSPRPERKAPNGEPVTNAVEETWALAPIPSPEEHAKPASLDSPSDEAPATADRSPA